MRFGLYIKNDTVELVDITTGEILTEGRESVNNWLNAYDGNFTLQLL